MDSNRKTRETLKGYFKKGGVPTEQQFAELIDSMSNIVEDGQVRRTPDGWAFHPTHGGSLNLDLFTDTAETSGTKPAWRLRVTDTKKLLILNENEETVLEMDQDKHVTLSDEEEPVAPTDEAGYFTIPADKKWHDVPLDFSTQVSKCRVFTIYASCSDTIDLCYLTCATVAWMGYNEQHIKSHQKHWWGWSGAVKIRWQGSTCLQIRSRKRLAGDVNYRIVETFHV